MFSPDGSKIASGLKKLKLWDVESGERLQNVRQSSYIADMAFSPDGQYLVLGGHDGTVKLYHVEGERGLYKDH